MSMDQIPDGPPIPMSEFALGPKEPGVRAWAMGHYS